MFLARLIVPARQNGTEHVRDSQGTLAVDNSRRLFVYAAGALARAGKMNLTFAVALAFIAVILADLFWYSLGRYRGGRILKLLCRISLEPDSCVRRTENLFVRHGVRSLLVAKFIPGLNTAAPSLAGVFRMPVRRFLIFDSLGGLLWVVTVTTLGRWLVEHLGVVVPG